MMTDNRSSTCIKNSRMYRLNLPSRTLEFPRVHFLAFALTLSHRSRALDFFSSSGILRLAYLELVDIP